MNVIICLVVWIASGMAASILMGMVEGYLDHKYGYDRKERSKIEDSLYEEWADSISAHGRIWSILQMWIVPLIAWPWHLMMVVAKISIEATNRMSND